MSQLIRCRVVTPYRSGGCNCPIRWDAERGRWMHDPDLETGVGEPIAERGLEEAKTFHRIHVGIEPRTAEQAGRNDYSLQDVYSCFHDARPAEAAQLFLYAGLRDRPRDLELAMSGQWINRRTPPPPERRRLPVPRRELERVAGLLYDALAIAYEEDWRGADDHPTAQQLREALGAYEEIRDHEELRT